MKILLVSPQGSDIFAKMGAQMPPLGLGYLAAFARKDGHDVQIIDLGVEENELTEKVLVDFDVVGISVDTPRYYNAIEVAKMTKAVGGTVVMGGYHATFMDKEILETGLVDFIVRGEGEFIFNELLRMLQSKNKNNNFEEIDGISYLKEGKYKRNKDAKLPTDLDDFPFPARDLFKLDRYKNRLGERPLANLITSRGCPFDCNFCSSTKFGGKKWRARSAKSIVDELEVLYRDYGYRAFTFLDDNFTISKKRIMEFADELEARNIKDIIWWCFSRVDILIKNEDMVKRMAEVGAFSVFLGLESANEEALDHFGKKISYQQQIKAIELLRKYGIRVLGSFILGDIGETDEMINKTVDWAIKLDPETVQFSLLTPYPGTQLYQQFESENKLWHKQWDLYDGFHSIVKMDHLSPEEMEQLFYKSYKRFYLRYSRIARKSKVRNNGYYTMPKGSKFNLTKMYRPFDNFFSLRKFMKSDATKKAIANEVVQS